MKTRPIPFSAPMVRSVEAGTKTQTRRAWRVQPPAGVQVAYVPGETRCPYGAPGDRLWVREAWRAPLAYELTPPRDIPPGTPILYQADGSGSLPHFTAGKLRPAMFMPRWASRILLEITGVRVERLQAITEADAIAEGVMLNPSLGLSSVALPGWRHYGNEHQQYCETAAVSFSTLWEQINGAESWRANPWVWVVQFKRVEVAHG